MRMLGHTTGKFSVFFWMFVQSRIGRQGGEQAMYMYTEMPTIWRCFMLDHLPPPQPPSKPVTPSHPYKSVN